jgi:hypothetical protein
MQNILTRFECGEIEQGYRQLIDNFVEYVELARDTAELAESYREFEVGNIAVAMKPGVLDLITVPGANLKIRHNCAGERHEEEEISPEDECPEDLHEAYNIPIDVPKVCAEMAACTTVEDQDLFFIGKFIAGTGNEQEIEQVTGIKTRTLPPCYDCAVILDKSRHTSRATLYTSVSLDEDIFQIRTMRHLKKLHKEQRENQPVGRISKEISKIALESYNSMVKSHDFTRGYPSRFISSFARSSLLYASLELNQ